MDFLELLTYEFIQKALIVGILVSLCAALLGVILVLKKYSMIGDGLSHVGFGALSLAMALNITPLWIAIPVVLIAAFFLLKLNESSKLNGDSAIGLIAVSSLAIGVIITSLSSGMNTDVSGYMFGSILAMSDSDVILSTVLAVVIIVSLVLFYNKIFAVTFDESFAKATGINTDRCNMIIAALTALTIVIGMRIMGTMLISGLIIFPALTSMRIFKSFKSVILSSAAISVLCFVAGIFVSFVFSIPTGACVVVINLIAYILAGLLR